MSDVPWERLQKLLALARQGVGGEAVNARAMLDGAMRHHGVREDEVAAGRRLYNWADKQWLRDQVNGLQKPDSYVAMFKRIVALLEAGHNLDPSDREACESHRTDVEQFLLETMLVLLAGNTIAQAVNVVKGKLSAEAAHQVMAAAMRQQFNTTTSGTFSGSGTWTTSW